MTSTENYSTELTQDLFDGQPTWFRNSPNPPLSANDAIIRADQFIRPTEFDGCLIDSVALSPFDADAGHWYWKVRFQAHQAGGFSDWIDLAVLMDGSVVTPTSEGRIDIGWPLPDASTVAKPSDLTDEQIVATFVTELNPHRTFAGTNVEVIGRITRVPCGHSHQTTGRDYHLTLNDGTILVVEPDGRPDLPVGTKLRVSGQLIGIREYDDRDPDWGSVILHPGIRLGATLVRLVPAR